MEVGLTWKSAGAAFYSKTWQLGVSIKGNISFLVSRFTLFLHFFPKDLLLAGDSI